MARLGCSWVGGVTPLTNAVGALAGFSTAAMSYDYGRGPLCNYLYVAWRCCADLCCRTGMVLPHWHGAAALEWCCRTGMVLTHWDSAAALGWCCRTGMVLPHWDGASALEWDGAAALGWCCRTGMVLPHWNGAAALNGALALDGAVHARVVLQHWMVLPALELCYPHRSRAARTRVVLPALGSCCLHWDRAARNACGGYVVTRSYLPGRNARATGSLRSSIIGLDRLAWSGQFGCVCASSLELIRSGSGSRASGCRVFSD